MIPGAVGLDLDIWDLVVKSASLIVAFAALVGTVTGIWWNNQQTDRRLREQDVRDDVKKLRENVGRAFSEMDNVRQRVATNEQSLKHVPSQESINNLQLSVEKMSGRIESMREELHGEVTAVKTALEGMEKLSEQFQRQVNLIDQIMRETDRPDRGRRGRS